MIFEQLSLSFDLLYHHHVPKISGLRSSLEEINQAGRLITFNCFELQENHKALIFEAGLEPDLWRPEFKSSKHDRVLRLLRGVRFNLNLWYSIVNWQKRRGEADKVGLVTTRGGDSWHNMPVEYQFAIHEAMESIETLCSSQYASYSSDDANTFLQMKEAFRRADVNGTGSINAAAVRHWMVQILQRNSENIEASDEYISEYVNSFMQLMKKGENDTITLTDFTKAIEEGLEINLRQQIAEYSENPDECDRESTTTTNNGDRWHSCMLFLQTDALMLEKATTRMIAEYSDWIMTENRYERIRMEDLLVVSCFIAGAKGIAENLIDIQQILVSY